jgi:EmrB/QacA subfamily drug resistance transporter
MTMKNLSKKNVILIMIGLMFGLLLASLDSTIVGTAMPKIIGSLKGFDYYTWPVLAYLLCITISMPLLGKLADLYGFKKIYVIGIIVFLIGSALCGLSQNIFQLIVFRGFQGIGGAVLISNTMAIIGVLFPPAERAKYGGLLASAGALASIVGPSLGGYITDHLSWRWVFYVNIPVGIVALIILIMVLPAHSEPLEKKKIDFLGALTFIIALVPLLLAFTLGGKNYAWNSLQIIGMFAFSAAMLLAFALVERKAEDPIIPLSLFKNSVFNYSALEMFLLNAVIMGSSIFLPLFVQGVIGSSASKSGAVMTPMMLSLIVGAILSGNIVSKTNKYKLQVIVGLAIMTLGTVLLSFLDVNSTNTQIIIDMLVLGFGTGIVMPIFQVTAQSAFPESQMGVVTSGIQFFKFMGSTMASAVLGTILSTSMSSGLKGLKVGTLPANISALLKNPNSFSNPDTINGVKAKLPEAMLPAFNKLLVQVKQVLSNSIHHVFILCIVIAVIALIAVLFMKDTPLSKIEEKDTKIA